MPGLEFRNLPANQEQEIKDTLHSQWQIEVNALRVRPFKSQQQANAELAKLNAKYQRLELDAVTKIQQEQREQQQKQKLLSGFRKERQTGEMGPERRAGLELELDPSQEKFVFGEPEPKVFTFQQLGSLTKAIGDTASRAEQEPKRKWGQKKTRKSLIDQYKNMFEMVRVTDPDVFGPKKWKQFNDTWNYTMRSDPKQFANWFDEKGNPPVEMKIAASAGEGPEAMKKKALGMSPIGRSLVGAGRGKGFQFGAGPGRGTQQQAPQQKQAPIRQRNTRTGQERISYDGGKTWQMIG